LLGLAHPTLDRINAMLKRPSELISPSNIKGLYTASDTYRSLQSFCNFKPSAVSDQLSASNSASLKSGFWLIADG
jgi:hypothetical protein